MAATRHGPTSYPQYQTPSPPRHSYTETFDWSSTPSPALSTLSVPRSRSNVSSTSSFGSSKPTPAELHDWLSTRRVTTLTDLCRIERLISSYGQLEEAQTLQVPLAMAWIHHVTSNQLLTELRGLTPRYPFSASLLHEAHLRVRADPDSNRSWNLSWMCLSSIREHGILSMYATLEAKRPEMWGGTRPTAGEVAQLKACFEHEWAAAVDILLRHWPSPPMRY